MAMLTSPRSGIIPASHVKRHLLPSVSNYPLHQRQLISCPHSSSATDNHLLDNNDHHISKKHASPWHLFASSYDRGIVSHLLNTAVGSATAERPATCPTGGCITLVLQQRQLWTRRALRTWPKAMLIMSVLPALVLAVQPLLCSAHHSAVLVDWQACIRDMFSFTVLLSVFITCEPGAAAASAVSVAGAALPLVLNAGGVPGWALAVAGTVAAAAATVLLVAATGNWLQEPQGAECPGHQAASAVLLTRVQQVLGVLGGGLLMQFITCHVGLPSDSMLAWLLPVTAGAAAVMLARRIVLPLQEEDSWAEQLLADWPAWSATLLLILQPLQQLVESAVSSDLLAGVCGQRQVLLLFASGLMVPRALLAHELMWFTGTCSASLLAAVQLVVMAVHSAATPHMAAAIAASATATFGQPRTSRLCLRGGLQSLLAPGLTGLGLRNAAPALAMMLGLVGAAAVLRAGWSYILQDSKPAGSAGSAVQATL